MSDFPSGRFTITNADSGRSIRAVLAHTVEYNDYQLGNTYTTYVTGQPGIALGDSANGLEAAWYHDGVAKPYHEPPAVIINVAVDEKQNIGKYAIGINNHPARTRGYSSAELEAMVPAAWTGTVAQWQTFSNDIWGFLLQTPPPEYSQWSAEQWPSHLLRTAPYQYCRDPEVLQALEARSAPPEWKDSSVAALADAAMNYHLASKDSAAHSEGGQVGMIGAYTETGWKNTNKRWQTDGTYIWSIGGGDHHGGPVEAESYLTDLGGDRNSSLVGLPKGGSGQKWILKSV